MLYTGRELLIYLSVKYQGDYDLMMKAIQSREDPDYGDVIEVVKSVRSSVLTYFDPQYPSYFKKHRRAPLVLYYYGDISLIDENNFANNLSVIGTREPTEYGINATELILSGLGSRMTIVSGLAKGIDTIAHENALKNGAKTIAVLGSGLGNIYPAENALLARRIVKSGGLVITEYPFDVPPDIPHFPERNRIIAELSRGTLVTEAYARSGTSITVGFAIEFGRDVMCVPYPIDKADSYCNRLINEGACLVRNADDVIDYMEIQI